MKILSAILFTRKSLFLVILLLTVIYSIAFAQDKSGFKNLWLVNITSKLDNNIKQANEDIQRFEKNIAICDAAIANSQKILDHAREKNQQDVQKVASDAINKTTQNKFKYTRLRNNARNRLLQSRVNLDSIKRTIKDYSNLSPLISAVATNYSGNITVQKNNGEKLELDGSNTAFLEAGDVIITAENSKVELEFLEGRGNIVVGENSQLKMEQGNDSMDIMNAINGKMRLKVSKLAEFEQQKQNDYEKYKNDTASVYASLVDNAYYRLMKFKKKFEIRTPAGALAVRGTEFLIYSNDDKSTGIIVLEGAVEFKSSNGKDNLLITAGQQGSIDNQGIQSKPTQQVDISKLEKWWEDEK